MSLRDPQSKVRPTYTCRAEKLAYDLDKRPSCSQLPRLTLVPPCHLARMKLALATLLPAVLAQVFPEPEGYKVQWTNSELVDSSRKDPFNSTHTRRIMVSQFKPITNCKKTCTTPYMSPVMAAIQDAIITDFIGDIGWPAGIINGLEVKVCCEAEEEKRKFPKILFGTGLNTTRMWFTSTAQNIAALGYEVIVMDHPYETDVVQFPDGEIVFGGAVNTSNQEALQFGLDVRAEDAKFVLDHFKICNTVYIGQSYGGAAVATLMPDEPRIAGGANLDGAIWGRAITAGVPRPFLQFGSPVHNDVDPSWVQFWKAMDEKYPEVWTRELMLEESVHGSFYDLSALGDVTDLRDNKELVEGFFGNITGKRVMEVMQAYLGDYIEFVMGDGDEGLLAGESEEWPDVKFLR